MDWNAIVTLTFGIGGAYAALWAGHSLLRHFAVDMRRRGVRSIWVALRLTIVASVAALAVWGLLHSAVPYIHPSCGYYGVIDEVSGQTKPFLEICTATNRYEFGIAIVLVFAIIALRSSFRDLEGDAWTEEYFSRNPKATTTKTSDKSEERPPAGGGGPAGA